LTFPQIDGGVNCPAITARAFCPKILEELSATPTRDSYTQPQNLMRFLVEVPLGNQGHSDRCLFALQAVAKRTSLRKYTGFWAGTELCKKSSELVPCRTFTEPRRRLLI
jgi:hypothetical protein